MRVLKTILLLVIGLFLVVLTWNFIRYRGLPLEFRLDFRLVVGLILASITWGLIRYPAMRRLFSFKGRVSRRTYWYSVAVHLTIFAIFIGLVLTFDPFKWVMVGGGVLYLMWLFATTWMGLALCAKRLHDCNMSGWWQLLTLIPFLGLIWAVVQFGFLKGTNGLNRYGEDPNPRSNKIRVVGQHTLPMIEDEL